MEYLTGKLKSSLDENILARVFMSTGLTDSYVQHPKEKKRHQAVHFCQGAAIARKSNLWKRRQSRGSFLNTRIQSGPSWTSNHDKQIPHAYNIIFIIIEYHYRASYAHTHRQLPIQLLPASIVDFSTGARGHRKVY